MFFLLSDYMNKRVAFISPDMQNVLMLRRGRCSAFTQQRVCFDKRKDKKMQEQKVAVCVYAGVCEEDGFLPGDPNVDIFRQL